MSLKCTTRTLLAPIASFDGRNQINELSKFSELEQRYRD